MISSTAETLFLCLNITKIVSVMRIVLHTVIVLFLALPIESLAQGYIKSDYVLSSTFKEEGKEGKLGSGDLLKVSGGYTLPLSTKLNEGGQVTAWSIALNGSYSILNNKEIAGNLNPEKVLNASLNIAHIRPLSKKWSLIASVGGGVYSEPNEISRESLLVNGGVIFIYKVSNKLDVGIGAGVTNSYGTPIAMPMAYLKLNLTGKYELKVDISTKIEIAGITKISDKFRLKLVAMEMDGISAVMEKGGKSMMYSSVMMRSFLSPEFKMGKSSTLFLGGGAVWTRSSQLTERSLKAFWDSFKSDDEDLYFKPAGYMTVGFRYGF